MLETAPFLIYKRRETWRERGSRVVEDEVLSDCRLNASPPAFSIVSSLHVFGRLALLRGTPVCFRQHLHPIPFRAQTNRHQHLFAGLFGCNRLRALCCLSFVNIYIHTFVSIRFLCVEGLCLCTSLLMRTRVSVFSPFPSIIFSSVQDPGGPASFLHARA